MLTKKKNGWIMERSAFEASTCLVVASFLVVLVFETTAGPSDVMYSALALCVGKWYWICPTLVYEIYDFHFHLNIFFTPSNEPFSEKAKNAWNFFFNFFDFPLLQISSISIQSIKKFHGWLDFLEIIHKYLSKIDFGVPAKNAPHFVVRGFIHSCKRGQKKYFIINCFRIHLIKFWLFRFY